MKTKTVACAVVAAVLLVGGETVENPAVDATVVIEEHVDPVVEEKTVVSLARAETQVVSLKPEAELEENPEENLKDEQVYEPLYTEEELEALALVIYCEAGADSCSDETRLMVGTVVMNRVASEYFPNTIEEVLLQERQYGRFHWTGLVWPDRASDASEAHAVERAYQCARRILSGERFLPEDVIFQSEYIMGEIVAQSDGMYFCR